MICGRGLGAEDAAYRSYSQKTMHLSLIVSVRCLPITGLAWASVLDDKAANSMLFTCPH